MLAVVDTGPLYAAVDSNDEDHLRCVTALSAAGLRLVIPAMVVAETTYLISSRMGASVEAKFLEGLSQLEVIAPEIEDWSRISELVLQYADFPLGGTDASVVALAERLETSTIITLDERHFRSIPRRHGDAFTLLPADL